MPLLAAVAAFGLARSGQVLMRAALGMALGFTYFIADNFSLAMGNAGAYPPMIAAWAPFILFLLIGETVWCGPRNSSAILRLDRRLRRRRRIIDAFAGPRGNRRHRLRIIGLLARRR